MNGTCEWERGRTCYSIIYRTARVRLAPASLSWFLYLYALKAPSLLLAFLSVLFFPAVLLDQISLLSLLFVSLL